MRIILGVALALAMVSAGCSDVWDGLTRPNIGVRVSPLLEGAEHWNRDGRFRVVADQDVAVRIEATPRGGTGKVAEGIRDVTITMPDGIWDLTYFVDGHKWDSFADVRIDATPPSLEGLERVGNAASGGAYMLGAGVVLEPDVVVRVTDLQTGNVIANGIPIQLSELRDGTLAFLVSVRDAAGNYANSTVQVRVGSAQALPKGDFDFGVVARYNNQIKLWDLSATYATPAAARAATGGDFLGAGFGITPDDDEVKRVVAHVVKSDMTTVEAAHVLFRYMADELEYDETRLDRDLLLTPNQVLLDNEDNAGSDANKDGLVDSGTGNGVKGGICRDLAATFVSLLRAAGIPARLVSGYVAGNVNGFHAWVEFYAGTVNDQPAWMPVDISPLDGKYTDSLFMQAFGILQPDYLMLRVVPSSGELEGWSTALSVRYRSPSNAATPDIGFGKDLTDGLSQKGVLCFNVETQERAVVERKAHCGSRFGFYIENILQSAERIIDYGVDIRFAPSGTEVTAEVAYPIGSPSDAIAIDYEFYPAGVAFTKIPEQAKARAELRR